jgi:hypothetical protein
MIFEKDFATGQLIPMSIGRISVGQGVAKIIMAVNGKIHLLIPESQRAYVHFYDADYIDYPPKDFKLEPGEKE